MEIVTALDQTRSPWKTAIRVSGHSKRRRLANRLSDSQGSQLLEFALVMPILLAICIGILDFGQAYNTKHYMTNAAREAARITVSNPLWNLSCVATTPCSLQAAADATRNYLIQNGLNAASCIDPAAPTGAQDWTWTWACNGVTLSINRGYGFLSGSDILIGTQVTLQYPYSWTFGRIIGLLVPGSTIALPRTLGTAFVMRNLIT